ncbi:Hypothetical predicted protein [Mytilus galloprovincialis]|uniref:YqaJ viral recombinase domain-containing protein n=1 Tax=Mytilus galloprovincialis TaxID=29158 RepID=A0A8B6H9I8_MYTGA|nr:Hypothetical predicted protein [Mytilus galloprovincialis]
MKNRQYLNLKRLSQLCTRSSVTDSGFLIDTEYPYIGVSADSIANRTCHGKSVVEFKCPYKHRDSTYEEYIADSACCIYHRNKLIYTTVKFSYKCMSSGLQQNGQASVNQQVPDPKLNSHTPIITAVNNSLQEKDPSSVNQQVRSMEVCALKLNVHPILTTVNSMQEIKAPISVIRN